MHRLMAPGRRSVLKMCNKQHHDASPPRKTRRSTCICYLTNNSNEKLPPRRKLRKNVLHEFSENESSKGNIEDKKKHKKPPSRKDSTDSVIYVGTIKSHDINSHNVPLVDLTHSSENLSSNESIPYSKSLKTLYFPSRNFDRSITLRKRLVTTSLINLPVIKKPIVQRRLYSATVANRYHNERLSILDLPDQFLDPLDFNFDEENIAKKTNLTESDQKIIDWILDQEINNANFRSASNNDFSSFDTGFGSIQELCQRYDVDSNSNFD